MRARRTIRSRLTRSARCPAGSDKPDEGQRLGEADQAEREWIVGEGVDLPGDHHPLELGGEVHRQQAGDEPPEVGDAERGVRVVRDSNNLPWPRTRRESSAGRIAERIRRLPGRPVPTPSRFVASDWQERQSAGSASGPFCADPVHRPASSPAPSSLPGMPRRLVLCSSIVGLSACAGHLPPAPTAVAGHGWGRDHGSRYGHG